MRTETSQLVYDEFMFVVAKRIKNTLVEFDFGALSSGAPSAGQVYGNHWKIGGACVAA
jgi:hypothetical protein